MKKYITVIFLLLIVLSCQKKKKWYYKYYDKGNLFYKIEIDKDSIFDGLAEKFYDTGERWMLTRFHKGINTDSFFIYYKNGKIKEKGYVENKNKIGWWKYFDSLGNLTKEEEIVQSKKDSFILNQSIYYQDGKIDSLKSSFYIIKILDKTKDSIRIQIFNNYGHPECVKHDTCDVINWAIVIQNPCNNYKYDTIFFKKKKTNIKLCRGNKPIKGIIFDQLVPIDKLENGLENWRIFVVEKHFVVPVLTEE